jgi:hypothetical protein
MEIEVRELWTAGSRSLRQFLERGAAMTALLEEHEGWHGGHLNISITSRRCAGYYIVEVMSKGDGNKERYRVNLPGGDIRIRTMMILNTLLMSLDDQL